jgi:tRNA A37 N6-isopentenylltransferase MiaA
MPAIAVRTQVFGGISDAPQLPEVLLSFQHLTVAELIQRSVEAQIRELHRQHQMDAQQVRRALERQYLTTSEITEQAQQGAVRFPSKPHTTLQIDTKIETKKALKAFTDGAYIILVNGQQVESLEAEITLNQDTKVTFLRLTPLVGG